MKCFLNLLLAAVLFNQSALGAPLPSSDSPDAQTTATELSATEQSTDTPSMESLESQAKEYLVKFGYLTGQSKNSLSVPSSANWQVREALMRLQKFAGLEITGELNDETIALMNSPRCHLKDAPSQGSIRKRYAIGGRWLTNPLTYDIQTYPSDSFNLQRRSMVDSQLAASFKDWTDVSGLVVRSSHSSPDMRINFYSGDHGDGYPFDGPGRILGHAFFPPYGKVHFDDSESWSSDEFGGPNLRQVGTHEIGHLLGLDHSQDRKSVMFPYYVYNYNFKLGEDDIRGIQSLYGSPAAAVAATTTSTTTTHTTTTTTTPQPPPTTTTTLQTTTTATTTTTPYPTTTTTSTTTTTTPHPTTTTSTSSPPTTTTTTTTTKFVPTTAATYTTTKIGFYFWWQWRQKELENQQS